MKLSDFDLPKTPSGDPCWTSGAKTNAMIKGKLISSGVTYRLKEHSSPVWKKWSTTLRDMERERQRLISAGESIDCIDNEINAINTPERKRAWDEEDALSDVYLDAKNRMNQMFARPEFKDIIYCADEMWIERRGSTGQFKAIEAVRECDVTMGFEEGGLPLVFYRLPDEKAQCDILATFADAYAKIHKLGIIHSDIKMHNMLIGRAGASPHVGKLIDFDAAFFASDLRANVGNMVYVLNTIGGTLMAPELSAFYGAVQNGGHDRFDLSRITTKLDVFSFAMSIYECMYGKEYAHLTPFDLYYNDSLFVGDDGTPIPFSMPVEINDCDEMDASFSIRPPREFEENHPFLHALLRWMLAFNPADRPTMEQVATVLRGYQTYQDTGITDIPAEYLPIDIHSP